MVQCPVCDFSNSKFVLYIDRIWKDKYKVFYCPKCGLFFLKNKPTLREVISYYQGDYYAFTKLKQIVKDFFRYFRSVNQYHYINNILKPNGMSILEIGACDGMLVSMFKKNNKVMGTEFTSKYKKIGKQKYKVTLINKNFEELNQRYDLIIMSHVFEHFLDIHRSIKELQKILKPKGYLFIDVPNSPSYSGKINCELDEFLQTTHMYNFAPKNITMLFKKHKMNIVDISRFYYNIPSWIDKQTRKEVTRVLIKGSFFTLRNLFPVFYYVLKTFINPVSSYKKKSSNTAEWLGQGDNLRLIIQKG